MRILLDSNAYSAFMRGSHEVRDLIQVAEEVLFSAVVVGEQMYGFRQGHILSGTWRNFDPSSNVPLRVLRSSGSEDCGPVLVGYDGTEGEGAPNSDQRHLDCCPRHGNGCRPGFRRQPLRAR